MTGILPAIRQGEKVPLITFLAALLNPCSAARYPFVVSLFLCAQASPALMAEDIQSHPRSSCLRTVAMASLPREPYRSFASHMTWQMSST